MTLQLILVDVLICFQLENELESWYKLYKFNIGTNHILKIICVFLYFYVYIPKFDGIQIVAQAMQLIICCLKIIIAITKIRLSDSIFSTFYKI